MSERQPTKIIDAAGHVVGEIALDGTATAYVTPDELLALLLPVDDGNEHPQSPATAAAIAVAKVMHAAHRTALEAALNKREDGE